MLLASTCFMHTDAQKTILGHQPDWDDQLDFEEIERRLQTEAIVERRDIRSFLKKSHKGVRALHAPDIVVLESGLKAVFKKANACYGEIAAYKAAKALGLRLVPPTVLRKIDGKVGSLQFYVASKIDLLHQSHSIYHKLSEKDLSDQKVFEYIFNRWDTHSGNQIISENKGKYTLALIDNAGLTFLSHKPKFNIKSINAATLLALQKINSQKALEDIWSEYLPVRDDRGRTVIERTKKRIELLLSTVQKKSHMVKHK